MARAHPSGVDFTEEAPPPPLELIKQTELHSSSDRPSSDSLPRTVPSSLRTPLFGWVSSLCTARPVKGLLGLDSESLATIDDLRLT